MIREPEFFTEHTMKESFGDFRDVYDHEVYLSFTNDGGGCAFHDWWNSEGALAFEQYCIDNVKELSEYYG